MSDIYIPQGCTTLAESTTLPQKRIGLQGCPGVGKTWVALKFKNPIVLNFDRGLVAHVGRSDVIEVPFHDPAFVDKLVPRSGYQAPPNRKEALIKWLSIEGPKLTANQTLIVDSQTQLQNSFHAWYRLNPSITKSGKVDDFAEWNLKVTYFGELMDMLKSLRCDVIYICHETADRDKTGELNGKIRPLLTGQFADQLASHFTDFFRCHAFAKPTKDTYPKFIEFFKLDSKTAEAWLKTGSDSTIYVFQTQSDEKASSVKTRLVNAPKYVLADPSVFDTYKR